MAITPEQARAELERRRAAKAQPTVAPTAVATAITPDMAMAELARRRAAKTQQANAPKEQSFLSSVGQGIKDTVVAATTPVLPASMPKKGTEEYNKVIEGTPSIQDIGQAIREKPVETAAAITTPALTVFGAGAGGLAGAAGGFAAASAIQRGAQSVDRKLFELTGGVVGNNNPKPSEVDAGLQILADQVLGAVVPLGARSLKTAVTAQRLGKLEQAALAMEGKATTAAQQAKLASIKNQIGKLKVSGETAATKLGDEQVFSYNGIRFDDAAKRIKGDNWDSRTFAGSLTAGKASDFGADAAVLNPVSGKLSVQNSKRLLDIVKKDNVDYNKALLPESNAFKSLEQTKKALDTQFSASQEALRLSQKIKSQEVFAPKLANTPITGSSLLKVFDDPEVVAAMADTGNAARLAAIRASVATGKPLTTKQLADMMSTIQSQFVSPESAGGRAAFYNTVYPKLQTIFEQAASSPAGGATKKYATAFLTYFENRFGLSDTAKDFSKTILENKPEEAIRALSNRGAFAEAKNIFDKFGNEGKFGDYMRLLISSASKDSQGQPQAHLLNKVLEQINTDVPEVTAVLGKDYIQNLKALQTVLNAEAIDGTKAQLVALASGRSAQKAKEVADEVKSLAVNTLAYNPLGAGAAQANIGRALVGQNFQPNIGNATVSQQATRRFTEGLTEPTRAIISGAGVQVAQPLATGYTSSDERRKAAEQKLKELDTLSKGNMSGQGGPEEAAPSMGGERDIASLMGTDNDPMGRLIKDATAQDDMTNLVEAATMQDDLDQLIRGQMEEDTKVLRKISTRQEEGFRTRMYKDTEGKRTVGIGFNMDAAGSRKIWQDAGVKSSFEDVLAGRKTITKAEAESLFNQTKQTARSGASRLVKNFGELGKHQQDALADMVFQLGQAGAMAFARTRSLIEQGKFSEAAKAMMESKNARQTPNRVMRRAYMLEHNVSLQEANDALVKAGRIASKDSLA
jgi:lysozyme